MSKGYAVTVEVVGGKWEWGRRQQNLRTLEPFPEPSRGRLETSQRLDPVFDADRDVASDEPIELIQAIVERLSLRGNVVFETLRAYPVAFLKHDHSH